MVELVLVLVIELILVFVILVVEILVTDVVPLIWSDETSVGEYCSVENKVCDGRCYFKEMSVPPGSVFGTIASETNLGGGRHMETSVLVSNGNGVSTIVAADLVKIISDCVCEHNEKVNVDSCVTSGVKTD